jgi:multimeric flavodoxin WrbA
MRILAICGSPKKVDTYSVLNTIKEIDKNIDFKIMMLSELNLNDCKGCYMCIAKGEENCPLKDDRDYIIQEMNNADGVIFASPTYVYQITSLMKKFIERTGFLGHRPIFFDKYAMMVGTCKGFGADKVTDYMKGIFTSYGFNVVSSLELEISTKSEKEQKLNKEKIISSFNQFIEKMKNREKVKPTIMQVVMFNILKYVSALDKNYLQADYEYYKDKEDFYYKTRIPFYMNWIAKQEIKKIEKNH